MKNLETDYHSLATSEYWTDHQIAVRLGELTLNAPPIDPPSGERRAWDKEVDALVFEQHQREQLL